MLLLFIELLLCISQDSGPSGNIFHLSLCLESTTAIFLLITTSMDSSFRTTLIFIFPLCLSIQLFSFSLNLGVLAVWAFLCCLLSLFFILSIPHLLLPRSRCLFLNLFFIFFSQSSSFSCFIIQALASEKGTLACGRGNHICPEPYI